jgi:hypothetical protein
VAPPLPPAAIRQPSDRPPSEEGWNEVTTAEIHSARLSEEMRGEVRAISRVAAGEAIAPLAKEIRELTAALERERRERAEGDARALQSAAAVAKKSTLPGVAEAPAPAALVAAAPPASIAASTPAPSVVAELVMTPTAPRVMPASQPPPARAPVARAPDLVIDSGPLYIDLPGMLDGARRRRRNAWLVSFFILAILGGLLVMMLLSQNQPR